MGLRQAKRAGGGKRSWGRFWEGFAGVDGADESGEKGLLILRCSINMRPK